MNTKKKPCKKTDETPKQKGSIKEPKKKPIYTTNVTEHQDLISWLKHYSDTNK